MIENYINEFAFYYYFCLVVNTFIMIGNLPFLFCIELKVWSCVVWCPLLPQHQYHNI